MEAIQEKQNITITRKIPDKKKNIVVVDRTTNLDLDPIAIEFEEELNFGELNAPELEPFGHFFRVNLEDLNNGYGLFKNDTLILFKLNGHLKICQNEQNRYYIPTNTGAVNNHVHRINSHNDTEENSKLFDNLMNSSTSIHVKLHNYTIKKLNSEEVFQIVVNDTFIYLISSKVSSENISLQYYLRFSARNHPDCCGNVTLSHHSLRGHYGNISDKFIKMYDYFIAKSYRGISKTIQMHISSNEYKYIFTKSTVLKETMRYVNPNSGNTVVQLNYIP